VPEQRGKIIIWINTQGHHGGQDRAPDDRGRLARRARINLRQPSMTKAVLDHAR
jgi:hypothetical protein